MDNVGEIWSGKERPGNIWSYCGCENNKSKWLPPHLDAGTRSLLKGHDLALFWFAAPPGEFRLRCCSKQTKHTYSIGWVYIGRVGVLPIDCVGKEKIYALHKQSLYIWTDDCVV